MTDEYTPSPEEQAEGMIVKNAVICTICRSPAHRYDWGFQCAANINHMGDLNMGIFSDLTYPGEDILKDIAETLQNA